MKQICYKTGSDNSLASANRLNGINHDFWLFGLSISIILIATLLLTGIVFAQPPLPTKPASEATGIDVNNIAFNWTASDPPAETYILTISKNSDMSSPVVTKNITGGMLLYTHNGTLEYNTPYYWRVSDGTQASPVLKFTTKTTPPQSTAPQQGSFIDTIVKSLGWPIILGIFCIVFIGIVLILAFRKPRKKSGDQWQGKDQDRRPPPVQNQCPTCGFLNPSNRQFCISCAGVLPLSASPSPGANQMGQQGMRMPGGPMGQMGQQGMQMPGAPMGQMGGMVQPNAMNQIGSMGTQQPWPPSQTQSQQQSSQNMVCPSCGAPTVAGRQFCGNCGASVAPPQNQIQQQTQQNVICPSCGAPNPIGRQFCGNCGTSLATSHQKQIVQTTQSFACPVCGAQINTGMNPCPGCGTWLEWGQ